MATLYALMIFQQLRLKPAAEIDSQSAALIDQWRADQD
ncbi:MAG: hypothetical protein ACRYGK_18645 [Janthinobacterium lividum]